MQKIKLLKSCSVTLGMILLCVFFSIILHEKMDAYVGVYILKTLKIISAILVSIDAIIVIMELASARLSKQFESLFEDVVINVKQKVKRYSKKCDLKTEWEFSSTIVTTYSSDKELVKEGLDSLFDVFNNSSTKAGISYFFLKHRTNENVALFLKNHNKFQSTCENVSESVISNTLKNLHEFDSTVISFDTLQELSMGILHLSLPQNEMIEDDMIYAVRSVIDWMCNNIDAQNMIDHKNEITSMLVAILELYKRIDCSKIKNKYLEEDFIRLQKLKWIKVLVNNAYTYLCSNKYDSTFSLKTYECVWITNILTAYANYVGYRKRKGIYSCIKEMNERFFRKYSSQSDDTCATAVLLTSTLGAFVDNKYIADTVSLMALTLEYSLDFINIGGKI